MKVTYIERIMRDSFSCIDRVRTITLYKAWNEGGLLYGYKERYNIVAIEHGSYTEMEIVKG